MPEASNLEDAPSPSLGTDDGRLGAELEQARAAIRSSQWELAFEALTALDETGSLSADDLESLGEAAWWLCRLPECIAARERSVAAHVADGRFRQAALVALRLFYTFSVRGDSAVATGWLRRASRLLEGEPEGVERGQLYLAEARVARSRGDARVSLSSRGGRSRWVRSSLTRIWSLSASTSREG